MRASFMIGAVALLLAVSPLMAGDSDTGVKWTKDYAAAKKLAADSNKRLFIEFTAEW